MSSIEGVSGSAPERQILQRLAQAQKDITQKVVQDKDHDGDVDKAYSKDHDLGTIINLRA